jgi:hypothetical protein
MHFDADLSDRIRSIEFTLAKASATKKKEWFQSMDIQKLLSMAPQLVNLTLDYPGQGFKDVLTSVLSTSGHSLRHLYIQLDHYVLDSLNVINQLGALDTLHIEHPWSNCTDHKSIWHRVHALSMPRLRSLVWRGGEWNFGVRSQLSTPVSSKLHVLASSHFPNLQVLEVDFWNLAAEPPEDQHAFADFFAAHPNLHTYHVPAKVLPDYIPGLIRHISCPHIWISATVLDAQDVQTLPTTVRYLTINVVDQNMFDISSWLWPLLETIDHFIAVDQRLLDLVEFTLILTAITWARGSEFRDGTRERLGRIASRGIKVLSNHISMAPDFSEATDVKFLEIQECLREVAGILSEGFQ